MKISIAEHMGLPILTVCNTCTLQLRTAKHRLDHDGKLKEKVNNILKEAGHPYAYNFFEWSCCRSALSLMQQLLPHLLINFIFF